MKEERLKALSDEYVCAWFLYISFLTSHYVCLKREGRNCHDVISPPM